MLASKDLDIKIARRAAHALDVILARRTRVKVVLGEERVVPGTLGEAIKLPAIIARLDSRSSTSRSRGLEDFRQLWDTLSVQTTREVLKEIGWYEPAELDWEDPRSNRRPDLSED